ncbi:MAG: transcription termination/antitermination protein NusA [Bradymonadales bacterium]|nr:transcription termination/antitermination protein NusA [Bradymonadales bacterium]
MLDRLNQVIDQIVKDKGIDKQTLIETVEAAIKTAAKRAFGDQRDIEAQYNEESGSVELFQVINVMEQVENPFREISPETAVELGLDAEVGDELLFQIFYLEEDREKAQEQDKKYGSILKLESARATFGRIAAQTAKQVIIQRIREAERDMIYNDFKDRKGELITGIVRRFEKGNIIVDLGRADAILPIKEQTPRESYRPGDRIQGYVKEIRRSSRDPQIVLSRGDPGLVVKLFEQEVPEIHEGIVKIVAVAREPGTRTKVAVYSNDRDVDPVGACVGMRGSRVQAVVQELRGEKIDIVPWNPDHARFVCSAISPAEVTRVLVDEANMSMELIVPDDQLSLAIGRGGQNVRLATQLTGWNLDIISQSRLKAIMNEARTELLEFDGVTEDMIDTLFSLGYNKLEDIGMAEVQEISQIPGYGEERARRIVAAAQEILSRPRLVEGEMSAQDAEIHALTEIKGVGHRGAEALYRAGYRNVDLLYFEQDLDRLATRTGLSEKKCQQIRHAVSELVEHNETFDPEAYQARQDEMNLRLADLEPIQPETEVTREESDSGSAEPAMPAGEEEQPENAPAVPNPAPRE